MIFSLNSSTKKVMIVHRSNCKKYFGLSMLSLLTLIGCQNTTPNMARGSATSSGAAASTITTQEPNLAALEKPLATVEKLGDGCGADETRLACDRRAILAMAGEYRVGFAFEEVAALRAKYTLKKPYRSGGEEWVNVIEDSGTHISLQHILTDKSGEITKHWRQDWDFQPQITWRYAGSNTWERRELKAEESKNAWTQTVWQVDDSPRYAGIGRWVHDGNNTEWRSDLDWRPLPRREHTTRSDYDVLSAVNRHEITPDGWVHLEDNLKLDTNAISENRYIAREFGVNRYQKIDGYNFKPARDYWAKTSAFWAQVRSGWAGRFAGAERITIKDKVDGKTLWMAMLEEAEVKGPRDEASLKQRSDAILDRYLTIQPHRHRFNLN